MYRDFILGIYGLSIIGNRYSILIPALRCTQQSGSKDCRVIDMRCDTLAVELNERVSVKASSVMCQDPSGFRRMYTNNCDTV